MEQPVDQVEKEGVEGHEEHFQHLDEPHGFVPLEQGDQHNAQTGHEKEPEPHGQQVKIHAILLLQGAKRRIHHRPRHVLQEYTSPKILFFPALLLFLFFPSLPPLPRKKVPPTERNLDPPRKRVPQEPFFSPFALPSPLSLFPMSYDYETFCPGTQNALLYDTLERFFHSTDSRHPDEPWWRLDRMLPFISGESNISLRLLEWFTTNYAFKYNVAYWLPPLDDASGPRWFKVHDGYQLKLDAYSKRRFDPCCRWERVPIQYGTSLSIQSTLGQLNFFKWALEHDVLDYVEAHCVDIDRDMKQRHKTSSRSSSRRSTASSTSSLDDEVDDDLPHKSSRPYLSSTPLFPSVSKKDRPSDLVPPDSPDQSFSTIPLGGPSSPP
jgi:hypothetical protein